MYGTTCTELEEIQDICNIKSSGYCHLNDQDEYTFELWVTKNISDHETQDLLFHALLKLNVGQEIILNATLQAELGNAWPELTLHQLELKDSTDESIHILDIQPQEPGPRNAMRRGKEALHGVLNVFLAPLLQFGSPVNTKGDGNSASPNNKQWIMHYAGNSPVTGEFPAQIASSADNVSIWWRHHALIIPQRITCWHQGDDMTGEIPLLYVTALKDMIFHINSPITMILP